jgi:hypothetical protein
MNNDSGSRVSIRTSAADTHVRFRYDSRLGEDQVELLSILTVDLLAMAMAE